VTCIRCGKAYPTEAGDWFTGCPDCLAAGYPASVSAPLLPGSENVSVLGEGNTPLVRLGALDCWVKNEGQNPSGSHKDRLSPLVVARAAALGRRGVVAASSGNQGASLALYAAAAGVPCAIITTLQINPIWARAISLTGAKLIMVDEPKQRWRLMQQMVEQEGWYPATNYVDPPVGSNPFGVQGYKAIAREILTRETPDVVVVPCSRGDVLWGIHAGFTEAGANPRLVAVEPFPRLTRVLAGEDYRGNFPGRTGSLTSIGGSTVTYQAVEAVRKSNGCAFAVGEPEAAGARERLAQAGIYAEGSSAVVLAALQGLRETGWVKPDDRVVLVVTSNGYKDVT